MYWTVIAGALIVVIASAALGFHIGYVWGWNDRGIHNRQRRAELEYAARRRDQWETTLLDDHRREAAADRHWEKILQDWAAEDGRQSHIMELPAAAWPAEDIPAAPPVATTGPQDVIA